MRAPDRLHVVARTAALLLLGATAVSGPARAEEAPLCPPLGTLPTPDEIARGADPGADIEISSKDAAIGVDGDATLSGEVAIRQGDRELRAEEVEYDASRNAFRVEGEVEYVDPLLRVRGGGGSYSAAEGARFRDAEFELPTRPARGEAEHIEVSPRGRVHFEGVSFTTCPASDTAWRVRAGELTLDTETRNGTGRRARVDFKGVPLIYLPWLSFPLGNERKSGFLFPSVGNSTRSGLQLSVPYYWNLAPNYDLSFDPTAFSERGMNFNGEFRYLSRSQRGALTVDFLPGDRAADRDRSRVQLAWRAELARGWNLLVDAENVSDAQYFEDFAQGPEGTSIAFVERLAVLSYRDPIWRLTGELQNFQTIDRLLPESERPYARVPRLLAGADWSFGATGALRLGFDTELVNFERDFGVTGWRLDAEPRLLLDFSGPGWFVRPRFNSRLISYELEGRAPGEPESPSRTVPQASLDVGLVLERTAGSNATERVLLEPRLQYLYTPFRNQSELPLFDTTVPDQSVVQLFRLNRYVGGDRVGDANELSAGVTARLIDAADGTQFLAATLGQTFYFETPRVSIPGETTSDRDTSDLVAQLSLTAYRDWNVDFGLQWNNEDATNERTSLQLQYRPDGERVANFAYRQQRDRLEQIEVSGAWPLASRWHAFARLVHSLREDETLEQLAGFEYRACCWRLRAVGRRFISSRTGEQDTGIYLQLELTGLASVGVPADAFLEQAIRGYSPARTNP